MELGLTMNSNASPNALRQTVQLAEEMGYSFAYVADQGFGRDVYVTLTMLAEATSTIRLGPGITHPYTRHPLVAAAAIASIDELSDGRAFLGLGAGGSRTLAPLNIKRTRPLSTTREAANIARHLWRQGQVTYRGEHFQVVEAGLAFPSRDDIEIHWAARGPKMLELGGEIADAVLLNGIPHFELENSVATVKKGSARSGQHVRINYSVPFVYNNETRRLALARVVYRIVDSPKRIRNRLGISGDLTKKLRQIVTTKGPAAAEHLMSGDILEHFILDGATEVAAEKMSSLFSRYDLDGLVVEVPDPSQAETLLRHAAQVFTSVEKYGHVPSAKTHED